MFALWNGYDAYWEGYALSINPHEENIELYCDWQEVLFIAFEEDLTNEYHSSKL